MIRHSVSTLKRRHLVGFVDFCGQCLSQPRGAARLYTRLAAGQLNLDKMLHDFGSMASLHAAIDNDDSEAAAATTEASTPTSPKLELKPIAVSTDGADNSANSDNTDKQDETRHSGLGLLQPQEEMQHELKVQLEVER
eukprot:TRINITY_DN11929_c1_g1_i4.p3 TRINITY_DN11929_c1_g1~~TRINITY_DN11929_c1_g1_i4.p3  ORF type:complete len:138 (-),score=23.32 TRINITY_DN11929_c1_g1_i4:1807-2220(-)